MLSVGLLALGVEDVDRAAEFWCRALGYDKRTDGFGGGELVLTPSADGSGTKLALQRSVTPVRDQPRVHLDLHVANADEQATEVKRLLALGATRVDWAHYPHDPDFVVLADTEGNRFCVVDLGHRRG